MTKVIPSKTMWIFAQMKWVPSERSNIIEPLYDHAMRTEEIKSWAVTNKAFLMAGIIFSATVLYLIFDENYESCEDS